MSAAIVRNWSFGLFRRHESNPILTPQPDTFYSKAIYNPCVLLQDSTYHLLFRAEAEGDPCSGRIGLAHSQNGMHFTIEPEPILVPEHEYEAQGCEDPRLVCFGDTYVLTYVGKNFRYGEGHICLATSTDLRRWQKHGVALHPRPGRWNSGQVKAAVISPVQSNGRYVMFYLGEERPWHTAIGLAFSDDLRHWQEPEDSLVLSPRPGCFDSQGVEPGPPPILTDQGLLLVYNGWNVDQVHCTGAVLLDPQNPYRVLARSAEPLLAPQEPWELSGYVPNVIFSEGLTQQGDVWHLYYGGADRVIGLAMCSQKALLAFDEE
jgi:predicted GH43/DUF377 family glycosyl hydrolase